MTGNKVFASGATAGFLLAVAAQGGNWLISPMSHPDASDLRKYGVIAQVLLCLGGSLWLMWRQKRSEEQVA
jgi:hypothetical protein